MERLKTLVYVEAIFAFVMAVVYSLFLGGTEFGLWLNGFGWILGLIVGAILLFPMRRQAHKDPTRFVLSIGAILGTTIAFIAGFYVRSIVLWALSIINFEAIGLISVVITIISAFLGILAGVFVGIITSTVGHKMASFFVKKMNLGTQRKITALTVIWIISIVGISGVFVNPSSPMAINIGRQGVSMIDLQMDYTDGGGVVGNFKSSNPGDTILFRDKIIRIEGITEFNTDQDLTRLYFAAHPIPYRFELERGTVEKESWYYFTWDGGHSKWATIFPMEQGPSEAYLVVEGERTRFQIGDTVELELHVIERMPLITEYDTEIIEEFWWPRARPFEKDEIRIVG